MKIEKVNDNQIRCILTREDLAERQMKLSELAYGTEKSRALFRDLMQQAAYQYGFNAENIPLMIEAVPVSSDSIILTITKVDNPEELDTRFSSFAPSVENSADNADSKPTAYEQLIDSIRQSIASANASGAESSSEAQKNTAPAAPDMPEAQQEMIRRYREFLMMNRLYIFTSMAEVIHAAEISGGSYEGRSTLLYDDSEHLYYLFLTMSDLDQVRKMQGVLASVSEYGEMGQLTYARQQYLEEHCRTILKENALQEISHI